MRIKKESYELCKKKNCSSSGFAERAMIFGSILTHSVLLFSKNSFDKTRFKFFAKLSMTPKAL